LIKALILSTALFCVTWAPLPVTTQCAQGQTEAQGPPFVSFCDLIKTPERYHNALVRTNAILIEGPEQLLLYDPSCIASSNLIWVDWVGYSGALRTADKDIQKKLRKYVKSDERARITIVGVFQARREAESPTNVSPEVAALVKRNNEKTGFGHLGCCSHQVVPSVLVEVGRVPKSVPFP